MDYQNNNNQETNFEKVDHESNDSVLANVSSKKSRKYLWIFVVILIIFAISIGVFFYFNFSKTETGGNSSLINKQQNNSNDDGINIIELGKNIQVEKNDIFQTPNKELRIKILSFKPDMTMRWGGGPNVKFIYNILNEEGEYEGEIAETSFLLKIGDYRITIVESDWDTYAKMRIEESYKKPQDCEWLPEGNARDKCYIDVVKYTLDVNDCYKIQNGNTWFGCILTLAPLAKDTSLCDKLEDMPMRYRCYSSVAATKQDKEICEKTETIPYFKKNECYQKVAVEAKDSSYCLYLEDQNEKNQCLSFLAKETESYEHCQNISEPKLKDRCYRDVYYKTKELKVCGFIEDEKERDYCYLYGAPQEFGDTNNCELISNHPDGQDRCFNQLAIKTQNSNYCEGINSQKIKEYCLLASSCDSNSTSERRDACYKEVMKSSYYFVELCGNFSTTEKQDECYLKHNNCDMVSDTQKRNDCLHLITNEPDNQEESKQELLANKGKGLVLTLATDNSSDLQYKSGDKNMYLGGINLTADTSEDIQIKEIVIAVTNVIPTYLLSSDIMNKSIENLYLVDNSSGKRVGKIQTNDRVEGMFTAKNASLIIKKGETKEIKVYGDIKSDIEKDGEVKVGLINVYDMEPTGVTSGEKFGIVKEGSVYNYIKISK